VAPSKVHETNPPLSSTMLIDWFEGSYDTFGEEKKIQIIINHGDGCLHDNSNIIKTY